MSLNALKVPGVEAAKYNTCTLFRYILYHEIHSSTTTTTKSCADSSELATMNTAKEELPNGKV